MIGQLLLVRQQAGVDLAIATVGASFPDLPCFHGKHALLGKAMLLVNLLALEEFIPGRQRMGKSAGKTDMGESAPCSKMGRAQVRKGGVLWI